MKVFFIKRKILYTIITLIIVSIVGLVLFNVYSNRIQETFKKDIFYQGSKDEKVIAFTCNVDWGNEYIDDMLKIFEKENINITFFVTGTWAKKNPELLKKIYSYEHQIGNHGYFHKDYGSMSYEENKSQILKCHNIISDILGIECKYFAPPSGSFNDNTIKAATELNYDIIMWNIDTIDWRKDSTKDKIINRVINKLNNSSIVLMHPTEETVKALPNLIRMINEKGYSIGKVSDVIE